MTPELVVTFARDAITTTIMVALPMLGLGLAVGLSVSIFQATTSIQEMTLTFVPKILVSFLVILLLAPWMVQVLLDHTTRMLINVNQYTSTGYN